ncbi:16S rRNA (guanine(966)-N(2))-methyltransferase RsmD [Oscillospiraceae bacterium CM]|nr:16S rRNA (guanine(966)-N(2))-methyltransferase RsmD [Oscillospiraceae bacterium CM]
MRIISGSARGRRLKEPMGQEIRPTTDMVKESVFNIIQFDIEGRRVLDLFAGTGQLGIEALSRGAQSAVFVDQSNDALALVRENLKNAGFMDKATVLKGDALAFLHHAGPFDLIFIDPPYGVGLVGKALDIIFKIDILKENGIIICETKADQTLPEAPPPYEKGREYRYGRIKISLYGKRAAGNLPGAQPFE